MAGEGTLSLSHTHTLPLSLSIPHHRRCHKGLATILDLAAFLPRTHSFSLFRPFVSSRRYFFVWARFAPHFEFCDTPLASWTRNIESPFTSRLGPVRSGPGLRTQRQGRTGITSRPKHLDHPNLSRQPALHCVRVECYFFFGTYLRPKVESAEPGLAALSLFRPTAIPTPDPYLPACLSLSAAYLLAHSLCNRSGNQQQSTFWSQWLESQCLAADQSPSPRSFLLYRVILLGF